MRVGVGARSPHGRAPDKRRRRGLTTPPGSPAKLRSRRERTAAQRPVVPSAPSAQQTQQGCRASSSPSRSVPAPTAHLPPLIASKENDIFIYP